MSHPLLSPAAAAALLASLCAEHGPGVLAALLGAAFAEDVAAARAEAAADPEDSGDVSFDSEWFSAFAEHEAFQAVAGAEWSEVC